MKLQKRKEICLHGAMKIPHAITKKQHGKCSVNTNDAIFNIRF